MQHILPLERLRQSHHAGGRIGSQRLRDTLKDAQNFCGLETDANRYDLLLLVKRAGKVAGFSPRMITLLDYYMSFTRECDWEEGAQPIVYQSLSRTALDLSVSERQVQRLERALFDAGALTWNDCGNHRRFGQRCPDTGVILYAFGVDLSPLAYLRAELQIALHKKQAHDQAWMETKRQISWCRAQIRACLAELGADEEGQGAQAHLDLRALRDVYADVAVQIRTHMSLCSLELLLAEHKQLHVDVLDALATENTPSKSAIIIQKTVKTSSRDDAGVTHYKNTTHQQSNKLDTSSPQENLGVRGFQESSSRISEPKPDMTGQREKFVEQRAAQEPSCDDSTDSSPKNLVFATGLQHITLKQALNAASSRFRDHLSLEPKPMNWNDIVEAAFAIKGRLDISQSSWANACVVLGRSGAAISLLLTDQATQREENRVMKPAAYFNAMVNRAKTGELHLHRAVFGILKREEGAQE